MDNRLMLTAYEKGILTDAQLVELYELQQQQAMPTKVESDFMKPAPAFIKPKEAAKIEVLAQDYSLYAWWLVAVIAASYFSFVGLQAIEGFKPLAKMAIWIGYLLSALMIGDKFLKSPLYKKGLGFLTVILILSMPIIVFLVVNGLESKTLYYKQIGFKIDWKLAIFIAFFFMSLAFSEHKAPIMLTFSALSLFIYYQEIISFCNQIGYVYLSDIKRSFAFLNSNFSGK